MNEKELPILIVGAGSIGERHIRNLLSLGFTNISVYRQRNLPLRTIDAEKIRVLTNWKEVESLQPKIAFITSPTAFHLEQAISCAELGAHLFIEKPISHCIDEEGFAGLSKVIEQNQLHLHVGYMMRYHPLLLKVRRAVQDNTYGQLISFHSHWGEYLPDWHPWEDYRNSYAARRELGGGAALTLSHDLDVALWITGSPLAEYHILKSYKNTLEIDVEGSADVLLKFQDSTIGQVHLNFVQRNPERRYSYRFEEATLNIDFFQNQMVVFKDGIEKVISIPEFDRNDLFIAQTKSFMNAIKLPDQQWNSAQLRDSETILAICNEKPLSSK